MHDIKSCLLYLSIKTRLKQLSGIFNIDLIQTFVKFALFKLKLQLFIHLNLFNLITFIHLSPISLTLKFHICFVSVNILEIFNIK